MVGRERGGQNDIAEAEKREARVRLGWRGCGPVSALPGYMNWGALLHIPMLPFLLI